MTAPKSRPLTFLDQLASYIPGYGGYQDRASQRATNRAFRNAIALSLESLKPHLDALIRECTRREAHTEIHALDRALRHVESMTQRLRAAGVGTDAYFASGGHLPPAHENPLHEFDHALYAKLDTLKQRFEKPSLHHDFLAEVEADLKEIEAKLDERALLIRGPG